MGPSDPKTARARGLSIAEKDELRRSEDDDDGFEEELSDN
jgi:hypothetical protein